MKFGVVWLRSLLLYGVCPLLMIFGLISQVYGQGFPQTSYAPSLITTGSGLDLGPSNPLGNPGSTGGLPQGSNPVYLSGEMFRGILPLVPNLEIGYLWDIGDRRVGSSRLTLDYLLPVDFDGNSVVFGEFHGEFTNFWKTLKSILTWESDYGTTVVNNQTLSTHYDNLLNQTASADRLDLSFGAGLRRMIRHDLIVGINAFCDTTRLEGQWYSSGSLGLEMAALVSGRAALDLNFNWYGNLFSRSVVANTFRRGPDNFDLEAGYAHELWNEGPDLRLKVNAYRFSVGTPVYGWIAGAEMKSRNGMLSVKYEIGKDRINSRYHTIGGSINLGLEMERLLSWESPFVMPEPIFESPRNLKSLLNRTVVRRFAQPAAVIVARQGRSYVVGDRVYSTTTRQAPTAGIYSRNVGSIYLWLLNSGSNIMTMTSSIQPAEVDPVGTGHVTVTITNDDPVPPAAVWSNARVEVSFFDTSGTLIVTSGHRPLSPWMPSGGGTRNVRVNLSPAVHAALAASGADIGAIGVRVGQTSGTINWGVSAAQPAQIVLNE